MIVHDAQFIVPQSLRRQERMLGRASSPVAEQRRHHLDDEQSGPIAGLEQPPYGEQVRHRTGGRNTEIERRHVPIAARI